METRYYFRAHIESVGTEYKNEDGSISKSKTGHMWYEIYEKDSSGNIVEDSVKNAGYTKDGIVTDDGEVYLGDPAFSTSELKLTKEQFEFLKDFGEKDSKLAAEHGFGDGHILNGGDYNPANNSCIDYTWKAMELAGINRGDFEGAVWPMANKEYLKIVVNDGLALNKYLAHFYDDESFRGEMKDMLAHAHLLGLGYTPSNSQIIQRVDPLILDLNGDGVKTTSLDNSNAFFDLSGNGMSNLTGWVDKSDGLLVYDRNNNGKIDDINELFGNESKSGFEALKEFDSNSDGKIDNSDEIYAQAKVNFIKPINSSRFYEVKLTV
jgi:hypothetical protein